MSNFNSPPAEPGVYLKEIILMLFPSRRHLFFPDFWGYSETMSARSCHGSANGRNTPGKLILDEGPDLFLDLKAASCRLQGQNFAQFGNLGGLKSAFTDDR